MANKLNNVIKQLIDMGNNNPIVSIHDQGCGGLANVVKEIIYPNGGVINLEKVTCGDNNLNPLEIWCSEFQESNVLLVKHSNLSIINELCKTENICCDLIGKINDSGKILLQYYNKVILDLPLEEILHPNIQKTFNCSSENTIINHSYKTPTQLNLNYKNIEENIKEVLETIDVGSKRFLTNKVDRSVTG